MAALGAMWLAAAAGCGGASEPAPALVPTWGHGPTTADTGGSAPTDHGGPVDAPPPQPDVPEPDVPEPDVPEPDVPEPDVPDLDLPGWDTAEPDIPATPDAGEPSDPGEPPLDPGTPPADPGTPPADPGTPPVDAAPPSKLGHWTCVKGGAGSQCVAVFESEGCGDGECKPKSGESAQSCPADCELDETLDHPCKDSTDCLFLPWPYAGTGYFACAWKLLAGYHCVPQQSASYCGVPGYDWCAEEFGETAASCPADCSAKALAPCQAALDCVFADWPPAP